MADRHWLAGFLAGYRTLSIGKPETTSINLAVGFNKVQFVNLLEKWRSLLKSTGSVDRDIICNMDESGITVAYKPMRIVAKRDQNGFET